MKQLARPVFNFEKKKKIKFLQHIVNFDKKMFHFEVKDCFFSLEHDNKQR